MTELKLGSQRFYPVFSSRSFLVLGFAFRSVIRFELIFVGGVKEGFGFCFFKCAVFLASFAEKYLFITELTLTHLSQIR